MKLKELPARGYRFFAQNPVWVFLFFIFALYLVTRLACLKSLPAFCDEAIYIRWSQKALHQGKMLVSLTDGKPPLHTWLMVPFISVFKDPLVAGRLASVFCGALTMLGIVLLGREFKDLELGAWAAFLYVMCPFALWYDRLAIAEGLLLSLFVWAVFFAVKAARSGHLSYLAGTAVATGLALLAKGSGQLLFLVVPFAYLLRAAPDGELVRKRPLVKWVAAVGCSMVVSYGVYSLLRFSAKFPLIAELGKRHTMTLTWLLRSPFEVFPRNIASEFRIFFFYLTPLFLALCLAGLVLGLVRRWKPSYLLWIWFLALSIAESAIAIFHFTRFFLIMLPPLLFGAAYAVVGLVGARSRAREQKEEARWLVTAAILVLLLGVALPAGAQMAAIISKPVKAWLPYEDRDQFIRSWTAAWGNDEVVAFLRQQSSKTKITVGAVGAPGTFEAVIPADSLEMYLFDSPDVRIVPVVTDSKDFPAGLDALARKGPVYCVLNGFEEVPEGWPLQTIKKYPKGDNNELFMILTRVVPDRW